MIRIGQILFTKDGRLTGNAIVMDVAEAGPLGKVYRCRTDFGNIIALTTREIENQYYLSKNGEVFIDKPIQHLEDQMEKLAGIHLDM